MTRSLVPTDFLRTRFIGYSVIHGAWPDYYARIANPANHELLWSSGGSIDLWADSNYAGWAGTSGDPANTDGLINGVGGDSAIQASLHTDQVDRVILCVSGVSISLHSPGGFTQVVSEWGGYIDTAIANVRAKYPNVRMIILQPGVGGPSGGATQCVASTTTDGDPSGFALPSNVVRSAYTSPYIRAAVNSRQKGNVRVGFAYNVSACSGFRDWSGHMNPGEYTLFGQAMGDWYNANV